MIEILLCLVLVPLGRLAGMNHKLKAIAAPATGLIIGYLVGVTDAWLLAFALAGYLGELPGLGHPMGHYLGKHVFHLGTDTRVDVCLYDLEWWEPEALREHPLLGLALRGLINAAPYLPIAVLHTEVLAVLLYALTWPLALVLGHVVCFPYSRTQAWALSEAMRHWPVGLALVLL